MDLGLKGRTALVTGASAGLGFASAAALAAEGCRLVICSRNQERIDQAAASLRVSGAEVISLVCDVTDEAQIRSMMASVAELFDGVLNILVTNAGGPKSGMVDDLDAADWRRGLELNLVSTINLARHALPMVRKAVTDEGGLGRLLMITSVSAKQPIPSLYLSNVSRAGVQGFAKSMSEELGPSGITVNTVLPGYTITERLTELAEAANARTGQSVEAVFDSWADATALNDLADRTNLAPRWHFSPASTRGTSPGRRSLSTVDAPSRSCSRLRVTRNGTTRSRLNRPQVDIHLPPQE